MVDLNIFSELPVREAMRRYLTALRLVYVPFREAEPDQLHDAWCPATAAKRHPEGQRDDGLTRDGRVTARRERIFLSRVVTTDIRHLKQDISACL